MKVKSKISTILNKFYLKRGKNQSGAAAVEFALLVPWLIIIIFAISNFGIAFNNLIIITNAAREGARLAAVGLFTQAKVIAYDPGVIFSATCSAQTVKGQPITVVVKGKALDLRIPLLPDNTGVNAILRNLTLTGTATMRLEK